MKKIIIVALLTMLSCSNVLATDIKIGFINVVKIQADAPQIEAMNTAMLERFGGKQKELEAMQKEIQTMQENLKRNELVMTEDKLNELKRKMVGKYQTFKQMEAILLQERKMVSYQELAVFKKVLRGIVDNVAKRDSYDLILSEGVAFAADALDITDMILDELKKEFKK